MKGLIIITKKVTVLALPATKTIFPLFLPTFSISIFHFLFKYAKSILLDFLASYNHELKQEKLSQIIAKLYICRESEMDI